MSTATRKPAPRLPRPAIRYWKGKAPKGVEDVRDSDSESEGGEQEEMQEGDVAIGGEDLDVEDEEEALPVKFIPAAARSGGEMQVKLKDVNISKDGKVIVAGRIESGKTAEGARRFSFFLQLLDTTPQNRKRGREKRMKRMKGDLE